MPRLGAVATSTDERCDAFWTMMNGGICSDSLGQFLRKDGTPVTFDELVTAGKADESGAAAKFIVAGSAILLGVVLLRALRS